MGIGILMHKTGIRVAKDMHFSDCNYDKIIGNMSLQSQVKMFKYTPTFKERIFGINIFVEISDDDGLVS